MQFLTIYMYNDFSQYFRYNVCKYPTHIFPFFSGRTKIKKIRGRGNISVGTWNVRTLRPAGKFEQLTHAMRRYHWNIVSLCEMPWKNLW